MINIWVLFDNLHAPSAAEVQLHSEFPLNVKISQYVPFYTTDAFQNCNSWNNSKNRLNCNISYNNLSPRKGYIVIFKRLAGIPNVAVLVRPMCKQTISINFDLDYRYGMRRVHDLCPFFQRLSLTQQSIYLWPNSRLRLLVIHPLLWLLYVKVGPSSSYATGTSLFRARCYTSLNINFFLLVSFLCFLVLFRSCYFTVRVLGISPVHEFHIFHSRAEFNFILKLPSDRPWFGWGVQLNSTLYIQYTYSNLNRTKYKWTVRNIRSFFTHFKIHWRVFVNVLCTSLVVY